MRRGILILAALFGTAACVRVPADCGRAGLSSVAGLECRASRGDKAAAFALGERLERGIGVARSPTRAAKLYREAASFTPGTTYVYSPPVGKHGRGMVLPVRTGPDRPGLARAKYRLGVMYLEGRGVRFDYPKGRKLVEEAAAEGVAEALEKLRELDNSPRT